MDELTAQVKTLRKELKAQTEVLKEIRERISDIEAQIEELRLGESAE